MDEIEKEYDENEGMESLEDLIKQANAEFDDEDETDDDKEEDIEQEDESESEDEQNESEEDNEDDESESEEDDNSDKEESNDKFEPITVKVNGIDVTISSKDEMMSFIKKGAESFNVKDDEYSNEKNILSQGKLTADDLKLLVDAKNGNAKAIAKLAKISNVDLIDIEDDFADEYTPEFKVIEETDIDKVAREIINDSELHENFKSISNSVPSSFINKVTSNANDLKTFSEHIKSGLAQEIIPEAIKLTYQGIDFAEAYVRVGHSVIGKKQQQQESNGDNVSEQKKERQMSDREKALRQKAKDNNYSDKKSNKDLTEDDIWNMSKEDFDAYTSKGN